MIVLDTNVVSEPLRQRPDRGVVTWLDAQSIDTLYLTIVTVAELRFGVASLPTGARRNRLSRAIEEDLLPLFADRVLAFEVDATAIYAERRAAARAAGRAVGDFDALIASMAAARRFAVATRDVAPFEAMGAEVINPFEIG